METIWSFWSLIGLGAGVVGGFLGRDLVMRRKWLDAQNQAKVLLEDAKLKANTVRKEAELEAKDLQLQAKSNFEKELSDRRREQVNQEKRLQSKEDNLDKRFGQITAREQELNKKERQVEDRLQQFTQKEQKLAEASKEVQKALERVTGLTAEEAKKQLRESLVEEARRDVTNEVRKLEDEVKSEAENKARYIISTAIERISSEYVSERSLSLVKLPSEDLKGRIIGREGRNIRAFEAATGVEVVIDETPDAVVLSAFNPVRREVARITMERLLQDGRIHPSRIEEIVEKVNKEVEKTIIEAGEAAFLELKLTKPHPEIIKLMGALKYRYSYAQNVLRHSIECGFICGMMAGELGLDEKKARRAGLMHDMGKAATHEIEGGHATIGMDLARKYKEEEDICHAIGAHHEDIPQIYALDCLVDAADALSGARPGARLEALEGYVKRMEDLEKISLSFKGVEKAYAVQAGREVRVMVNFQELDDSAAFNVSKDIARKIEKEMTFPGQIKVTVVRETRAVEYAK